MYRWHWSGLLLRDTCHSLANEMKKISNDSVVSNAFDDCGPPSSQTVAVSTDGETCREGTEVIKADSGAAFSTESLSNTIIRRKMELFEVAFDIYAYSKVRANSPPSPLVNGFGM